MPHILFLILVMFWIPAVSASECPDLPEAPQPTAEEEAFRQAWQWVVEPYSVYDYAGSRDQAPLGIGHLKVEHTANSYYTWPSMVVLPI